MYIKFTKDFRGYKRDSVVKTDEVVGGRYLHNKVAVEVDKSEYTKKPCKGCGEDEPCKDCEETKEVKKKSTRKKKVEEPKEDK